MEQHYATMDDVIKALARMALKTLREKGGEAIVRSRYGDDDSGDGADRLHPAAVPEAPGMERASRLAGLTPSRES